MAVMYKLSPGVVLMLFSFVKYETLEKIGYTIFYTVFYTVIPVYAVILQSATLGNLNFKQIYFSELI